MHVKIQFQNHTQNLHQIKFKYAIFKVNFILILKRIKTNSNAKNLQIPNI